MELGDSFQNGQRMTGHLNLLILVVTFSLSPLGAMVIVGTLLLVVKVIVTVTMECITINRKIELFNLLQVFILVITSATK